MAAKPSYDELAARVTELERSRQKNAPPDAVGSARRLHEFIEQMPSAIAMFDREMRYVCASRRWLQDYGLSGRDLRGRSHYDVFPEIGDTWKAVHRRALAGQAEKAEADRFERADGSVQWLRWEVWPWRDRAGEVAGIVIFSEDITERKQLENELADSVEKYRLLYDNAPLAYQSLDDDGRFIDVNPAWLRTLGYERDEVIGHRYAEFLHPDWQASFATNFPEFKRRGYIHDLEFRLRHKAGHYLDVAFEGCVGYTPEGDFRQTYCVFQDITARKKAEVENEALQLRMRQAQKMESIGNLAGGIAHDFNNLLFPIIGMSEMLLENLPAGSPEHEDVQQILAAGKRAGQLVEQILAFSRQSEHRMMPVRIQQVLREVVKLTRALIPADVEIREDICSDCGAVLADQTQIHQIAMNLITNALHAMDGQHGTITIALREVRMDETAVRGRFLSPGRHAVLTISDTGCGIDPAVMDRIFEPYFTTKEPGKGTGLGLAMVYGIVREHGGDIRVDSQPGRGTAVEIHLPVLARPVETSSIRTTDGELTGDEHILLVDDEPAIARLETQMLEQLGYRVTSRVNSTEALEAFRAGPDAFDLVLTDMTMPGLTGDELAREVRTLRPGLPVVICTGFSERIDAESAAAMGIQGFLMKPVLRVDMARTVRQVLDAHRLV